jgi:hypothetical protein
MSGMNAFLHRLRTLLADFVYGIDAGNAIRHGLEPSRRRVNTR